MTPNRAPSFSGGACIIAEAHDPREGSNGRVCLRRHYAEDNRHVNGDADEELALFPVDLAPLAYLTAGDVVFIDLALDLDGGRVDIDFSLEVKRSFNAMFLEAKVKNLLDFYTDNLCRFGTLPANRSRDHVPTACNRSEVLPFGVH